MLLLAALSDGVTEIRDLLHSDDTERMLDGLRILGVKIDALENNAYRVQGCGGNFPVKKAALFLGNAGTAFRPLTAVLALAGGEYELPSCYELSSYYELSGVARMHERPIADLVDALRGLGADISYSGNEGFPPLIIRPAMSRSATIHSANKISVRGDVSSQFLTALLMAVPLVQRDVVIEVVGELISKPYIEITLNMMAQFGVHVARDGWTTFTVRAGSVYKSPGVVFVEGDASSASYFLAAGAIAGAVRVEGVGKNSIQGDVRFIEALQAMGAQVEMGDNWISAAAPKNNALCGIDLDCNHIPDAAMTLAVCALFADGTTTLRNIASWRVKETDRIHAMATELRKVGSTVEEGADFICITPPAKILYAAIDTYDDHRMAMCFSLVALGEVGVRINDPHCVAKTFPDYFARFAEVVKAVPVVAIDGPSASGKGTVAQLVAQALGFHYLDSGALYRLLALAALQRGIALDAEAQLAQLAAGLNIRFAGEEIWLDEVLVGQELRSEQTAAAASTVAALPAVRAALLEKQHAFRRAPGLVADGRDMASVVFPDAVLKIFLTASAEARAKRRAKQLMGKELGLMEKEMGDTIATLLREIRARDERDTQRSAAPLQQAVGASLLDTTSLTIAQAVQEVLNRYHASNVLAKVS